RPWTAATIGLIAFAMLSGTSAALANFQRKAARAEADARAARAETGQVVVQAACRAGLDAADDALGRRDALAAKVQAEKVLDLIQGAPFPEALDDLRAAAEEKLARAGRLTHALETYHAFLQRRDDVLLHLTPFTGVAGPDEAGATAEAAREALAVV